MYPLVVNKNLRQMNRRDHCSMFFIEIGRKSGEIGISLSQINEVVVAALWHGKPVRGTVGRRCRLTGSKSFPTLYKDNPR